MAKKNMSLSLDDELYKKMKIKLIQDGISFQELGKKLVKGYVDGKINPHQIRIGLKYHDE